MPILRIFFSMCTPFDFSGTTINDLFRCGGPSDVFARQHIQSACVPFVIQSFVPLIT